jgi:hypothetical protein
MPAHVIEIHLLLATQETVHLLTHFDCDDDRTSTPFAERRALKKIGQPKPEISARRIVNQLPKRISQIAT